MPQAEPFPPSILSRKKLLALYPLPTNPGTANNYSYADTFTDTENQYNFRVDHNFSANQRTFVRGTRDTNTHHENDLFNQPTGPNGINQSLLAYLFALGHTGLFHRRCCCSSTMALDTSRIIKPRRTLQTLTRATTASRMTSLVSSRSQACRTSA